MSLLADLPDLSAVARSPLFGTGLTLGAYVLGIRLQALCRGHVLANPTMIAMIVVGLTIETLGVRHETYMAGAAPIHWLLGPAVVLFAVPLLRQAALIRASRLLVALAVVVGVASGLTAGLGIAWVLGASKATLLALAPKSVTVGAAIGVAELLGGAPSLTAALVVLTGLVGAVAGSWAARLAGVRDERAVGLAFGIASQGLGTARALRISPVAGAFAGIGMAIGSVVTAALLGCFALLR